MGKKYIIELKKNETLYKAATRESDGTAYVCSAIGTPYTEPDLEQVKSDAYNDGYKAGREAEEVRQPDLEHVRKKAYQSGYETAKHEYEDCTKPLDNGKAYQQGLTDAWEAARKIRSMTWVEQREVFGTDYYTDIIALPVSECIEKIRQYEQEKDKQARIEYNCDEIKDVLNTTMKECNVSLDEIAEVLAKMKETDNG